MDEDFARRIVFLVKGDAFSDMNEKFFELRVGDYLTELARKKIIAELDPPTTTEVNGIAESVLVTFYEGATTIKLGGDIKGAPEKYVKEICEAVVARLATIIKDDFGKKEKVGVIRLRITQPTINEILKEAELNIQPEKASKILKSIFDIAMKKMMKQLSWRKQRALLGSLDLDASEIKAQDELMALQKTFLEEIEKELSTSKEDQEKEDFLRQLLNILP